MPAFVNRGRKTVHDAGIGIAGGDADIVARNGCCERMHRDGRASAGEIEAHISQHLVGKCLLALDCICLTQERVIHILVSIGLHQNRQRALDRIKEGSHLLGTHAFLKLREQSIIQSRAVIG